MLNLLLLMALTASADDCTYSLVEESPKITWTGFKFTEKAAVSGTFKDVDIKSKPSKSLKELFSSVSFSVDTNSIDSGNVARDTTLKRTVFGFLKEPNTVKGSVTQVEDKNFKVNMTMNNSMLADFTYTYDKDSGKTVAQSTLDLTKYGLLKSYNAVAEACKALHTGDDGVSKTWTDVDLKLEVQIEKKCSAGLIDSVKSWFGS